MEELRHPPVEIDDSLFANQERAFAQRAFATLEKYALDGQDYVFGQPVHFPVTDRIDMPVAEDSAVEIAMRLVGTPTYRLPERKTSPAADALHGEDSSEYIVVELQYGELDEDNIDIEDGVDDDDFDWQSYIVVVIDAAHPYNPSVLDARNGAPLSASDLMQASVLLEQVCAELDSAKLDQATYFATHGDEIEIDKLSYGQFYSGDFMPLSSCEACSSERIPCSHNLGELN